MKKTTLPFLPLFILLGCGPSLRELMAVTPIVQTTEKDTFCVYSKFLMFTLSDEPGYRWRSGWDPSIKKGELIRSMNEDTINFTAFSVYRVNDKTNIELRIAPRYGLLLSRFYSKNKLLMENILASADFSSCPDSSGGEQGITEKLERNHPDPALEGRQEMPIAEIYPREHPLLSIEDHQVP